MNLLHNLSIIVNWRIRTDWRATPLLERAARFAAESEGFRSGELSVTVVGQRAMARLHREFMDIDGPTDVITFDLGGDLDAGVIEGEIVVCADVAKRVAARRASSLKAAKEELTLYVVHGVLHLAGYNDHADDDFTNMHAREDELLAELGLGRVFDAGAE